jgi:LysM repeat protein
MPERDDKPQDNFVMSGAYSAGDDREESPHFDAAGADPGRKAFKPVLVAGIVLLVAVIVLLMFLSGSPRSGDREQLKNLEARLKQIEEKLSKLEWIDTGMARIDRRDKELAGISDRLAQLETGLNRRIDQLAREAAKPAPKPAEAAPAKPEPAAAPKPEPPAAPKPVAAKPEPPAAPKPAPAPAAAKPEAKGKIHVVQQGETLYGIARKYNLPVDQLLKLNQMTLKDTLKTGQQLVVGR